MSPDSKPNRGPSPSCGSDRSIRTRKTGLDCRITKGVWAAPAIRGRGDRPGLITIQCKAPASGSGGQCAGACQSMLRRPPPRPAAVALAAGPGPGDPRAAGFQGPGRRGLGRQRRGRLAGMAHPSSAVQSRGRPGGKQGGARRCRPAPATRALAPCRHAAPAAAGKVQVKGPTMLRLGATFKLARPSDSGLPLAVRTLSLPCEGGCSHGSVKVVPLPVTVACKCQT